MIRARLGRLLDDVRLPRVARTAIRKDRAPLPEDPGIDQAVAAMTEWLCRAQDHSMSADGGFARHYSLIDGWASSYPETTGYIVPTLFALAKETGRDDLRDRACRALDWLVSIQMENGAFQGGPIGVPPVPVAFNTGQILLGLAAGHRETGAYEAPLRAAARFLADAQDADGCWRAYASPYAGPGEHAYDAHAAFGLMEADRALPGEGFGDAALANGNWVLGKIAPNGWIADCCLTDAAQPLTHTLGYALKGILEAYRFSEQDRFLAAARRVADGLRTTQRADGALPGLLDAHWQAAAPWTCLTGNAQIAECWWLLFEISGDPADRDAARRANAFGRRCLSFDGLPGVIGGVKGSHPIEGTYGRFQHLNWAAKFNIDSNLLEGKYKLSHDDGGAVHRNPVPDDNL